jgi:hypothetical protein
LGKKSIIFKISQFFLKFISKLECWFPHSLDCIHLGWLGCILLGLLHESSELTEDFDPCTITTRGTIRNLDGGIISSVKFQIFEKEYSQLVI